MTKIHLPLLAFTFVVMAVTGWSVDRNSAGHSAAAADRAAPPRERSSRPERRGRAVAGPTGEAAERLAAIRATRDPLERTRATITLANTLPVSEFAAWLGGSWFQQREGEDATLFKEILMERWLLEDPEAMLVWRLKNDPNEDLSVVALWVETNPQRVLDFFKLHPNDQAEVRALREIAGKNPGLALQRLQQMAAAGMSQRGDGNIASVLEEIAKQSPAALEAALDSLPAALKFKAEVYLIRQKMETGFSGEFGKLLDRADGFELFSEIVRNGESIDGKIFDDLANLPASWRAGISASPYGFVTKNSAERWVTADLEGFGFTEEQARKIRSEGIDNLKGEHPETAIKLMAEADLDIYDYRRYLREIFAAAKDNPEKTEALMALLTSDDDRQVARDAKLEEFSKPKTNVASIEKPADWLTAVAALDLKNNPASDYDNSASDYLSMVRTWDPSKLAELSRQFESLPDDKKWNIAHLFLDGRLRSGDPLESEALHYLVARSQTDPSQAAAPDPSADETNSSERPERVIPLATDYVAGIALENPDQAAEWIHSLPDGDAKLWATKNLQSIWSHYDPAAADQWFNSLPANMRSQVKGLVSKPKN
ncbi:MAG: hypothetical protein ABIS50_13635 [Luteolibacter sp.]|uniref:hypothetical protein n=1 Tax=Luteolibacter sp. TaxID=1962973 RepID=UPI003264292C